MEKTKQELIKDLELNLSAFQGVENFTGNVDNNVSMLAYAVALIGETIIKLKMLEKWS